MSQGEAMKFKGLVEKNRSYRRFRASREIDEKTLLDLVDLARMTPSAANRQPLKYVLSCTPDSNAKVFETLGWAASLPDWPGPDPEERPSAYIIVLVDKEISDAAGNDVGIASQTILLGAVDKGLGGCMLGNVKKNHLSESLGIPDRYEIQLVIALGVPVEKVVLEGLPADGSTKYHRDEKMTHYVPKRSLEEIIIKT
jgi:nitroreductase